MNSAYPELLGGSSELNGYAAAAMADRNENSPPVSSLSSSDSSTVNNEPNGPVTTVASKWTVQLEDVQDDHHVTLNSGSVYRNNPAEMVDDPEYLISTLPRQRRDIVNKRGAAFTLMVAGESGLGKTTFINTLFGDKLMDPQRSRKMFFDRREKEFLIDDESNDDDGPPDLYEKTTSIEIQEAVYEEQKFKTKFTVIDTPGFGDYTDNNNSWFPIINYIDEQHRIYMLREEQPNRQELVDTRVHACLYFIRPSGHGLSQLDIKAMKELSSRVNLVPIISKADSFSLEDRDRFKRAIRRDIESHGIKTYQPPISDISSFPFAIISSEHMIEVPDTGQFVRGRQYRWGVAEVENEDHCEFVKLRRLLMTEHMLHLIDTTIYLHYEAHRQKTMLDRISHYNYDHTNDDEATALSENDNGLKILKGIHAYGRGFLQNGLLEHDPIFTEKKTRTSERFDVVVSFQEKKFEQWRAELKAKQDEYNGELEQLHSEIMKLQSEVELLEYNPHATFNVQDVYNDASHPNKPSRSAKYTIRG